MKMTEQETASSLFDEVKKLQARIAFLEKALDQAIEIGEFKVKPSEDHNGKAAPESLHCEGGWVWLDGAYLQLESYLKENQK